VVRHIAAACLVVAWLAGSAAAATTQEVSFKTDDGVTIAGTLFLPGRPGPAVILVHALSRTREDWSGVASRLADAGIAALAIDLRGHGASGPLPDGTDLQQLTPMSGDLKAARAYLATRREVTPGRVGVAGASIGANLAILLAASDPAVRSLALLSPGIDYRGLRPEAAIKKYGDRPAMLVASQEDGYATNSARELSASGGGVRDLRILNGAGHGTNMLVHQPDLAGALVDWFRRTLL
jgi:dienelactone hydrolase